MVAKVVQRVTVGMNVHLCQAILTLDVFQLLLGLDNVDVEFAKVDVQLVDGILSRERLLLQLVNTPLQSFNSLT